jgi:SnoaL-like domain
VNPASHLESFFAAWQRHDARQMGRFYAEEAVMEDPVLPEPRVGRADIERYYAEMFAELEHPKHELLDYAARRDRIWFEWTFANGAGAERRTYHGVSIQTVSHDVIVHDAAFWSPDA